jgi:hypothetical protein
MKPKHRKISSQAKQQANPGPVENAKAYRVGNPSGRENLSIPRGRGDTGLDHSATEKQNQ